MKICVCGLWHLGCVTAVCLSEKGYEVTALDDDKNTIDALNAGKPPIYEPGLNELLIKNKKNIIFTTNYKEAISNSDIIWVTYDTPVYENGESNVSYVIEQIKKLYPYIQSGTTVLISSQLPVGTTSNIEKDFNCKYPYIFADFAYSPENLRVGNAIKIFNHQERIIIGSNTKNNLDKLFKLLSNFTDKCIFVSVESSEMIKHAINSFLATEIAFINEVAVMCENTGANIREVENGIKSDKRIGYEGYLNAGSSFSGLTLKRDLNFLSSILKTHLISSVNKSNDLHSLWSLRTIFKHFNHVRRKEVGILGLTYKCNTNILHSSDAIKLCRCLKDYNYYVRTHDPIIKEFPDRFYDLKDTIDEVISNSDILVLLSSHEEYIKYFTNRDNTKTVIIDPNGILKGLKFKKYYTVGQKNEI